MTTVATTTSSAPCAWVLPRPHTDASQRLHTYGPVQPMEYDDTGSPVLLWAIGGAFVALAVLFALGGPALIDWIAS